MGFIIYIYICVCVCERERERDLKFNWILDSLAFTPNNSFATKIKKLIGHLVQNWTPNEIQFRI